MYDHAKAVASNQYALPVLTYLMWTQTWPLAELQQIDRDTRKIISGVNCGIVLDKKYRGRGLKSVGEEEKNIKIKVKLYENSDPSMTTERELEEKSMKSGRHSFVKDEQIALKF